MSIDASRRQADVSVIMPAYQSAATIERALTSIASQTLQPLEVIVVDDGSTDGTFEIAHNFADHMNGIPLKVYRQDNQGPGAARNRALREASATYVAFLDSDDEWLAEKIARSMTVLEAGNYDLVSHDGWEVHGSEERPLEGSLRFKAAADPFIGLYRRGFIDNCAVVVRRDLVDAVGGFDATLPVGQDFDLQLKILGPTGRRFTVFDDKLVRYHILPDSVTRATEKRLACQRRILRRHAASLQSHKQSPLSSVLFRTLAVFYEALQAHIGHQRFGWALYTVVRAPFALVFEAISAR